jgi:hypothetical protein
MYKEIKKIGGIEPKVILRVFDQTWIPFDPANTDYQEYLKWLAEGNEPLPPDEILTAPVQPNERP